MDIKELNQSDLSYLEGFVEKCAELGVDPEAMLEKLAGCGKGKKRSIKMKAKAKSRASKRAEDPKAAALAAIAGARALLKQAQQPTPAEIKDEPNLLNPQQKPDAATAAWFAKNKPVAKAPATKPALTNTVNTIKTVPPPASTNAVPSARAPAVTPMKRTVMDIIKGTPTQWGPAPKQAAAVPPVAEPPVVKGATRKQKVVTAADLTKAAAMLKLAQTAPKPAAAAPAAAVKSPAVTQGATPIVKSPAAKPAESLVAV